MVFSTASRSAANTEDAEDEKDGGLVFSALSEFVRGVGTEDESAAKRSKRAAEASAASAAAAGEDEDVAVSHVFIGSSNNGGNADQEVAFRMSMCPWLTGNFAIDSLILADGSRG